MISVFSTLAIDNLISRCAFVELARRGFIVYSDVFLHSVVCLDEPLLSRPGVQVPSFMRRASCTFIHKPSCYARPTSIHPVLLK